MAKAFVLVVDDEPAIRETVAEILLDEGYEIATAENAESARQARKARRPDLILLDVWMPDSDGVSLLKEWQQAGLEQPVVMMSGHGTVETAVEATRHGAYDFLEKPLSLAKLLLTVERALEAGKLKQENQGLKKQLAISAPDAEPIGSSKVMQELKASIERAAQHDAWVLFEGEAGTGKETLARYLHNRSKRAAAPFVALAPGLLGREQAALELLGSEQGGQIRYGMLERAQGGSLFIDEITDLSVDAQMLLAAALQRRALTRIGSQQSILIDVRVLSSSSKDLEAEVRAGRLREDLLYALRVVPMRVPALRERPEDIPELVKHFAEQLAQRDGLPFKLISIGAQNRLRTHAFPGNLRELKNLVQRLLIMAPSPEISAVEVEASLGQSPQAVLQSAAQAGAAVNVDLNLPIRDAREQFEREYLLHQLKLAGGSVGKLAKVVGLERTHLYRKLRALGLELSESN
jgi:DNA-binding NtrC family response regulator